MKLQQLKNGQFVISLPKQIVLAKRWEKGKNLKVEINSKGNIVLKE
jgi:hypothetical protein